MPIKLANNATSTIATAINASDVGVVFATGDGAKFPTLAAGEYFYITFESSGGTYEIAKATARAGDSLTIVRAQEGTTAQSFAAGSRVELRVTAASINDLVDEHDQASEISFVPYGWIAATNVQDALEEVVDELNPIIANFTGTGAQVSFDLLASPTNENSTQIYINGVYQQKNTYSVTGSIITFSEAPPVTSTIEVNYV